MSRRCYSFVFPLIILLISGCVNSERNEIPNVEQHPAWIQEFLQRPACQLPCWNGITPSITTIDEAKDILNGREDTKLTAISKEYLEWDFLPKGGSGYVESEDNKLLVDIIDWKLNETSHLLLEDVTGSFSDPSSIFFEQNMHNLRECNVFVLYEKKGLVLSTYGITCVESTDNLSGKLELQIAPETKINGVTLIAPGDTFRRFIGEIDPIYWKGYGAYSKTLR